MAVPVSRDVLLPLAESPRKPAPARGPLGPNSYNAAAVKPDHRIWPGKLLPIERGTCRWCGATILRADGSVNRRRTFCDTKCVKEYLLRVDPKLWRKRVYDDSMGICAGCGQVFDFYEDGGWQADHKVPLFHAYAVGDWTAWDPSNGQLLCTAPCPQEKSASDFKLYGYPERWPKNFKKAA